MWCKICFALDGIKSFSDSLCVFYIITVKIQSNALDTHLMYA